MSWSQLLGNLGTVIGEIGRSRSSLGGPSNNPLIRRRALSEIEKRFGLKTRAHSTLPQLSAANTKRVKGFIGPRGGAAYSGGNMAVNVFGEQIPDEFGPPRRRRRGGITARDLRSFRRVANLIKRYAAPVRHMRTKPHKKGF